jgi:hypothetical protein
MPERLRQTTNYIKSVPLPQPDRTLVCRDHQVVLHRPKTPRDSLYLRMFTHRGRDSLASGLAGDNVATVADVRSQTRLVRFRDKALLFQCVSSENCELCISFSCSPTY